MSWLRRLFCGTAPDARLNLWRPLVVVAGLALLLALPYVLDAYYIGVLTEVLVFGLWAMSLNVLAGNAGLLSLGHASLLGISAYTVAIAQGRWDWSFATAALLAIAVTMAVSTAFALMAMRATAVYFLMITLAQGMLVWGLAQSWVSVTDGDNGLRGAGSTGALDEYYNYYWFTVAAVAGCLVVLRLFLTSAAGLRLRGVKDSPTRMASLGYNVLLQRSIAFNVSGFFAAIAGVLYIGYFGFVSPTTVMVAQSVEGLLMVIFGGIGVFFGPMLGAAVVIGIRTGLSAYTDRWSTLMGLLLVLSVLFTRQGLGGLAVSLVHRRHRVREKHPARQEDLAGSELDPSTHPVRSQP